MNLRQNTSILLSGRCREMSVDAYYASAQLLCRVIEYATQLSLLQEREMIIDRFCVIIKLILDP